MGEEVDFFGREGIADIHLVAKLQQLIPPPADPALLARLIDEFAGSDLYFGAHGLAIRTRSARKKALPLLRAAKNNARKLIALDVDPNFSVLDLAIADLAPSEVPNDREKLARSVIQAIELLADLNLDAGASAYAVKSPNDQVVAKVVLALGTYFTRQKIPFSGEPRSAMVDGRRQHLLKSDPARLTATVLKILGLKVSGAQLGTHSPQPRRPRT